MGVDSPVLMTCLAKFDIGWDYIYYILAYYNIMLKFDYCITIMWLTFTVK